jgi:hypothetical protein
MLSPEEREALARRAANLRTEISDLTAERDAARASNAASADDARLIAEVRGLEVKAEQAKAERDQAVGAAEAIVLMREAMEVPVQTDAPAPQESVTTTVETQAPADSSTKTAKGGSR